MSGVAFRPHRPDESRILSDGDHVGDVYALDDPLREGSAVFRWCISTRTRGSLPRRIDRDRIREVAEQRISQASAVGLADVCQSQRIECGGEFGRCLRPGLSAQISGRWRSLR